MHFCFWMLHIFCPLTLKGGHSVALPANQFCWQCGVNDYFDLKIPCCCSCLGGLSAIGWSCNGHFHWFEQFIMKWANVEDPELQWCTLQMCNGFCTVYQGCLVTDSACNVYSACCPEHLFLHQISIHWTQGMLQSSKRTWRTSLVSRLRLQSCSWTNQPDKWLNKSWTYTMTHNAILKISAT